MHVETYNHGSGAVALRAGSLLVVLDIDGKFVACGIYAGDQLQVVSAGDQRRFVRKQGRKKSMGGLLGAKVHTMYQSGMSFAGIARELHVSSAAVERYLEVLQEERRP